MENGLYIIIGAYGSGKSEYAINLARQALAEGNKTVLADLDVVNPYFRSRDMTDQFTALGMEVIAPAGEFRFADLPMLSPRLKTAASQRDGVIVFDVGGDPAGCRVLSRLHDDIAEAPYNMILVVNTRRPFTTTAQDIQTMHANLEKTSGLTITEYVCNTHLMQYTTPEIIEQGVKETARAAELAGVPFSTYLVLEDFARNTPDGLEGRTRQVLTHFLLKPWENRAVCGRFPDSKNSL